ncbi:MAG: hypothetical protein WD069_09490 [Planctomycetales bacterium]
MSLSVHAYTRDAAGNMTFVEPNDKSKDLAGFEVFRTTFYGGNTARSLGLRLLPLLPERDLYVEGEELSNLKEEAILILQNIESFTAEASAVSDVLRVRVENILDAIGRAQSVHGCVVIW